MVMRKTIKKARTMQTEINGTFHSMKNSSLNFRKLTNGTAFSEIYEFKGRFPFDQIKIPVWISWNFHGRMVQTFPVWKTTSRAALFVWNFSMISRFKSQTEHRYVDIATFYLIQTTTAAKWLFINCRKTKGLHFLASLFKTNKYTTGHYFYKTLSSRI